MPRKTGLTALTDHGRTVADQRWVFDTLYALDHTLSPKPMMVDKETISEDRLTYPPRA